MNIADPAIMTGVRYGANDAWMQMRKCRPNVAADDAVEVEAEVQIEEGCVKTEELFERGRARREMERSANLSDFFY